LGNAPLPAGTRDVDIFSMGRDTKKKLVDAALETEDQDHQLYLEKLKQLL